MRFFFSISPFPPASFSSFSCISIPNSQISETFHLSNLSFSEAKYSYFLNLAKLFFCHWLHVVRTVHDYMRVDLPGLCCYKGWLHAAKTNYGCIQSEICAVQFYQLLKTGDIDAFFSQGVTCMFEFPIISWLGGWMEN